MLRLRNNGDGTFNEFSIDSMTAEPIYDKNLNFLQE